MKNNSLVWIIAFLLSFTLVSGLEQPINDFLWDLQIYPSEYILVFEESIDSATEAAALSFMDHFGMSRSRIDSDGGLPADKLVVIGRPTSHKVIKNLGITGNMLTLDSSNGNKLIVAGDASQIEASLTSLKTAQLTAPPSGADGSQAGADAQGESVAESVAAGSPPVEQLSPASDAGFLGNVKEQYAPGMSNTLFLGILGGLVVSPLLAFGVVRHSKKKKVNVQKDQLKQYLAAYVQRGYTKEHLQQYFKPQLLQKGWDGGHIDEVFESLDDGAGKTLPA